MPKISDQQRDARRRQILDAAWACFGKRGLHVTTMADIIRKSGLSAGAVYLYFDSKEEIIQAAVTTSLGEFATLVGPILEQEEMPDPPELVGELMSAIDRFTQRKEFSLRTIAIHGWSEAQSDKKLKATIGALYRGFRARLVEAVKKWQVAGVVHLLADPEDVAKTILSMLLGFLVQSAMLGDAAPDAHTRGLAALVGMKPRAKKTASKARPLAAAYSLDS